MAEKDPNAEEEGADPRKPTSRRNSNDKSSEGTSINWEKAKKIKNVYTGPVIPKPKMDMAKALTIMGFSSTRSLDPHTNDTRDVLATAVDKKGLKKSRPNYFFPSVRVYQFRECFFLLLFRLRANQY